MIFNNHSKGDHNIARIKDLTGEKYYQLTFLYPDKNNKKKWICKCDCGNIKSVIPCNVKRGLTKSCGCLHSKIVSENFTKDLTGKKFGRLTVIDRDITKQKSKGVYWNCLCECGNIISVITKSLKEGNTQSCGCLKSELSSKRFSLNLTNKIFGKLVVIRRNGTFVGEDGTKYSQWLCRCECGTIKTIRGHDLVRGSVTSCGCTISRGEEKIRKILNEMNINFDTQYSFSDLKSNKGWVLRFDFALLDNEGNLLGLIEYQGQQHFDDFYGWFGEQQRNETDLLKRKYCNTHNIPFYEISYNESIELSLINILSNFEFYKSIPCQAS